jgi:solute carrier family 13 (sodium-dependent dicarboxylate transporter), member 2/3/5
MSRILLFRLGGPLLGLLVFVLMRHYGDKPAIMAGLVAWMALWWISEAVPIPITSILPLVLYPLLGIDSVATTAAHYGREIIFLFLGGFIIALGIERSGAHKRIALHIVSFIGGSPSRLILGMMIACALLSMWINSTATTLVMLPIALSLLDDEGAPAAVRKRMTVPLLLGVAYGATIGGMATPVGTPPNLVLIEYLRLYLPGVETIGFAEWMSFGVPLSVMLLAVGWLVVTRLAFSVGTDPLGDEASVKERLTALGRPGRNEVRALLVFVLVAMAWMTGDDLRIGDGLTLPGWRGLTGLKAVSDAAIAVAGATALFLIPSAEGRENRHEHTLMTWHFAESRIPWGVLLLIGGGFALAAGVDHSGLSVIIGEAMSGLGTLSPVILIATVALIVCLLSELGSNTATATLVIPILASMAAQWGMDPRTLLVPATLGASLGFMLPVASPMQTIVFSTGRISVRQMVRGGVWMDLIGVVILALYFGLR